jgi:hypothetical protein
MKAIEMLAMQDSMRVDAKKAADYLKERARGLFDLLIESRR